MHYRNLQLNPYNIFAGRIITSSAKPEKRIVAHKASIIEIVKITIEGAHEPLSSSYEGEENFVGDSEIIALGGASNETKDRPLG
ncbi:hypothetical protein MESMUL_16860 [Mesosutterella multiformis]|uniref:Uncharacterized protein n=1 Tax=Mesosutterella multiformis TaxID=2259133 RepID=A0A388SDB1_9BURK|nr:hypothetical protein [Mesosutterella multiformis]GBO92680.1 hypothetical protein MESMUL_00340 [Mesosutterella multiformis]GBO94332.1 hypothetical protein MESMUL_16860 [Mesosutterella multiformis]